MIFQSQPQQATDPVKATCMCGIAHSVGQVATAAVVAGKNVRFTTGAQKMQRNTEQQELSQPLQGGIK